MSVQNTNYPVVTRGDLHFIDTGETIKVWLGPPCEHESEFMGEFHKYFIPCLIAGFKASMPQLDKHQKH